MLTFSSSDRVFILAGSVDCPNMGQEGQLKRPGHPSPVRLHVSGASGVYRFCNSWPPSAPRTRTVDLSVFVDASMIAVRQLGTRTHEADALIAGVGCECEAYTQREEYLVETGARCFGVVFFR